MLNGQRYTFDVAGLYNGLFVMSDRQTGSVWTHYEGSALSGSMGGQTLVIAPLIHTTWEEWVKLHPETTVLDWYPEFSNRYREVEPGRGGLGLQFQKTVLNWDDRLAESELVLGVAQGDTYRAYILDDFSESGLELVQDSLNGSSIIVLLDSASTFGIAFESTLQGISMEFYIQDEQVYDRSGTRWDLNGMAIEGPHKGEQLNFVTSFVTEWYGWAAYHPETSIYGL